MTTTSIQIPSRAVAPVRSTSSVAALFRSEPAPSRGFQEALAIAEQPLGDTSPKAALDEPPPSAETDDLAQPSTDEAQESPEAQEPETEATEPSGEPSERPSDHHDESGPSKGESEASAVHVTLPEQPLTIRGLNRLLLSGEQPALPSNQRPNPADADEPPALQGFQSRGPDADEGTSTGHESAEESAPVASQDRSGSSWATSGSNETDSGSASDPVAKRAESTDQIDRSAKIQSPSSPANRDPSATSIPPPATTTAVAGANATSRPQSAATRSEPAPVSTIGPPAMGLRLRMLASMPQTQPTSGQHPTQDADSAFAAQLSRGLTAALSRQDGSVTLRLEPEHLGRLRIEVGIDGGSVTARFEASTPQARDLLGESMAVLRSSLESRGLEVDRLHVQVAVAPEAAAANPTHPLPQSPEPSTSWNAGQDGQPWADAQTGGQHGNPPEQNQGDAERNAASNAGELAVGAGIDASPTLIARAAWTTDIRLHLGIDTLA